MPVGVKYVVTATYYAIVDRWRYDTEEEARAKYSELLVSRPKWKVKAWKEETVRQGQESPG